MSGTSFPTGFPRTATVSSPTGDGAGSGMPTVVLTGRPNVGKSTLFNRIVGATVAVVEPTAGVTRDRLDADALWNGCTFRVTDTGGLAGADGDPFAPLVATQARAALAAASVVLLVVDGRAGLQPGDRDVAEEVRRLGRPVLLVANKCEASQALAADFYPLGLGEPLAVSAMHGEGVGDLLDLVVERFGGEVAVTAAATDPDTVAMQPIAAAFIGKPNVGKSSLLNRLLGSQRLIVSERAGTTRDAVDVPWCVGDATFLLVDTPGMRRPARIERHSLEHWSAQRSARAVERCEVAALVLDATASVSEQDKRIAGLICNRGRAAVLVLNKVDLLPAGGIAATAARVRDALPFLHYAEVVPCSAQTGRGLQTLPGALERAALAYRQRLTTSVLNSCLRAAVATHPPAAVAGKPARIYYAAQIAGKPPTVCLIVNRAHALSGAYVRYLENRLRERFDLRGTPLRFAFRVRRHRALTLRRPVAEG